MTVPTTNGTTAFGDYAFNLHGDDGAGTTHDLALTLRVNNFTNTSNTGKQTIQQTGTGTYTVTLAPEGTFSDTIHLACANFSRASSR